MVNRVPLQKSKPAPIQKFYKGDQAVLVNDISLAYGPTLAAGNQVTVIDVDRTTRKLYYLVELAEQIPVTAWVVETELQARLP